MRLIDDQEVEPVPDPMHRPVGALEGSHRDALDRADPVSQLTDRAGSDLGDRSTPLIEQDSGGDQAQRGEPGPRHRGQCDLRLAAARRERNQSALTRELPCEERRLLIRPQLDSRPAIENPSDGPDAVRDTSGMPDERLADAWPEIVWRTMGADPLISSHSGQLARQVVGVISLEDDRAGVEAKAHRCPTVQPVRQRRSAAVSSAVTPETRQRGRRPGCLETRPRPRCGRARTIDRRGMEDRVP